MSPKSPNPDLSKEKESATPDASRDIPPKEEEKAPTQNKKLNNLTFQFKKSGEDLKQEKLKQLKQLKQDAKALSRVVRDISENLMPKPKP